ncbi:MAG TPA: hypothetical protein VLB50_14355 [Ignavibacteriaceae bacterium]|nr:hypothetical protein [Ignavibacteriaceae bacterium]
MSKNKYFELVNFDSMKCIWMSSKIIDYKLCDKNFDCDNCAFDKIMRNINPENASVVSQDEYLRQSIFRKKAEILKSISYSKEYHYLNNSVILKKLFDKTYYLGLDRSAYLFLDNITGYEFLNSGPEVNKGEAILKLSGDWGEMKVLSPANFFIVDKLNYKVEDLKEKIWLCLIETEDNEIENVQYEGKEYECILDHLMLKLYEFENKYKFSFLGTRMNDGGTEVKFLYQAIGIQKYKEFLKSLLSNEC